MSAFKGKRKGFRVSRHLNRKSTASLRAILARGLGKDLSPGKIAIGNIAIGILKSRGERI